MKMTIACALAAALLGPALAVAEPHALPAEFEACTSLRRDAERLLCYDKAVMLIKAGTEGAAAPSAENMFGANTDVLGAKVHQGDVKREELKQISGSVTSLHRGDDGMIRLELDNGQVWRQQDADVRLNIDQGDQITIVRAVFGTFRITDKSGRFARFKRVR